MKLSRRRPTATLLALLLAVAASPVAAADPTPSPEAAEPALTSPPTVHAEMEAEHRDDPRDPGRRATPAGARRGSRSTAA